MIPTQNLVPGACDPQQTAFSHLEPWTWSLEARNGFTSLGSGFYTMECVALCVSLSLAVVVDITKQ